MGCSARGIVPILAHLHAALREKIEDAGRRYSVLPVELRMLAFSVILGLIHIVAASHSASLQRGYKWTASARDHPLPPLTGIAGRLARALTNFGETFPFFA